MPIFFGLILSIAALMLFFSLAFLAAEALFPSRDDMLTYTEPLVETRTNTTVVPITPGPSPAEPVIIPVPAPYLPTEIDRVPHSTPAELALPGLTRASAAPDLVRVAPDAVPDQTLYAVPMVVTRPAAQPAPKPEPEPDFVIVDETESLSDEYTPESMPVPVLAATEEHAVTEEHIVPTAQVAEEVPVRETDAPAEALELEGLSEPMAVGTVAPIQTQPEVQPSIAQHPPPAHELSASEVSPPDASNERATSPKLNPAPANSELIAQPAAQSSRQKKTQPTVVAASPDDPALEPQSDENTAIAQMREAASTMFLPQVASGLRPRLRPADLAKTTPKPREASNELTAQAVARSIASPAKPSLPDSNPAGVIVGIFDLASDAWILIHMRSGNISEARVGQQLHTARILEITGKRVVVSERGQRRVLRVGDGLGG